MSPIFAATLHKLETGIPEREAPNTSSGKLGAAVRIPILLAKSCCVLTLGPVKLPPVPIRLESPITVDVKNDCCQGGAPLIDEV